MALDPSVFVHDKALCESDDVGLGTRVWAFAHVMAGARVGAGCNVGDHAFLESGVILGSDVTVKNNVLLWDGVVVEDRVFLGPNAVFTNDRTPRSGVRPERADLVPTLVRHGASIGANATIVCGVTIGTWAMIGAGSVVTADVAAHGLVFGNPARPVGWVCECCRRLDERLECSCGRSYVHRDDGQGLVAG